jgi:predicted phage tail protein
MGDLAHKAERQRPADTAFLRLLMTVCGILSGCGYVGDPKPPALEIPARILDLRAVEYGDQILTQFTIPALTTEGLAVMGLRAVELRIQSDGNEKTLNVPNKAPGPITYQVPVQEWIGKQVRLTVRAIGRKGKASEWSNEVAFPVIAPLPAPTALRVENAPKGVRLSWQGSATSYRVLRSLVSAGSSDASAAGQRPARVADASALEYTDETVELGLRYRYMLQALDGDFHQSAVTEAVEITPKDEFPPAVPSGLTAVAGVNSIELAWDRNTEDDFAGYSIYRSPEGGDFEKIAGPIDAPAFSDRAVEPGKRYRYVVTSVDTTGNESARSMQVEALAQ